VESISNQKRAYLSASVNVQCNAPLIRRFPGTILQNDLNNGSFLIFCFRQFNFFNKSLVKPTSLSLINLRVKASLSMSCSVQLGASITSQVASKIMDAIKKNLRKVGKPELKKLKHSGQGSNTPKRARALQVFVHLPSSHNLDGNLTLQTDRINSKPEGANT